MQTLNRPTAPPRSRTWCGKCAWCGWDRGVDATGELAPEALERTFAATADYASPSSASMGRQGSVFGNLRAAMPNRQVFVDGIRDLLGVEPEVISGDEEAALSFAGASSVLPILDGHEVLVVDLGGGSTEFVLGTAAGVTAAKSVDIGCVRLTERHLQDDPPSAQQIADAEADVDAAIAAPAATYRWNAPPPSSALPGPSPPSPHTRSDWGVLAGRNPRR